MLLISDYITIRSDKTSVMALVEMVAAKIALAMWQTFGLKLTMHYNVNHPPLKINAWTLLVQGPSRGQ